VQITAVKNYEQKKNSATAGELIKTVYAAYVYVYGQVLLTIANTFTYNLDVKRYIWRMLKTIYIRPFVLLKRDG
jgi:hypothetical protein